MNRASIGGEVISPVNSGTAGGKSFSLGPLFAFSVISASLYYYLGEKGIIASDDENSKPLTLGG
tara:strand:- start:2800 stop:2991 length:192 start_codon:yes stop_codon:yes gene_type:complete